MSRLLKRLSPFAPDGSGACAVLYELGGITVICDAGGCAGNVCGFDEPRWYEKKSALFSAGLRDMDAILGRDDLLVRKLATICGQIPAAFTAIIGTPVPAVIATDYKALARMSEKQTGLPCLALDTNGANHYDAGAEKAYVRIFEQFAGCTGAEPKSRIGVLGATPLDTGLIHAEPIKKAVPDAVCFGLDSALEAVQTAGDCREILVIAPCALKAAQLLQNKFGVPYRVGFPCLPKDIIAKAEALSGQRVLIVHQQFAANALREHITGCTVSCATWFMQHAAYAAETDFRLTDEAQFIEAAAGYDVIIADEVLRRAVPSFTGEWIDLPHYAVSGRLTGEDSL